MKCIRIVYMERPNKKEDIIQYFLFPTKLVVKISSSKKLKEYKFENQVKTEAKLLSIIQSKYKIGYHIINDIENPIYYNLFNTYHASFLELFKNKNGVKFYYNRIEDSDHNYFLMFHTPAAKANLIYLFPASLSVVDFFSNFKTFDFQVDINRNAMMHRYRFSLETFAGNVKWTDDEPLEKLKSPLGQSMIEYISQKENISFKLAEKRIKFLSKGISSFVDIVSAKVYSIEDYEPNYSIKLNTSDVIIHKNLVQFMEYIWERLYHDISYSLEYK